MWCLPPKADAAFVCQMEEVLDVYRRPYDPKRPQICMDEMPKQLIAEKHDPVTVQPGQPHKQDYEYERHGTTNVFMMFEPLAGQRYIEINSQRKAVDWAHVMKTLSDELYPDAEVIVLVMDNLNTHKLASFYEAFEPEEAQRLNHRFELHYTPKHGSWLNMAEIELSALARQCLNRRIPDQEMLDAEAQAWAQERNNQVVKVDWRFTTADARVKLKHLYPKIQI
jgi:transposase